MIYPPIDLQIRHHELQKQLKREIQLLEKRDKMTAEHKEEQRMEKLEQLLLKLKEWQADPSNVNYQPVAKLIRELSDETPTQI